MKNLKIYANKNLFKKNTFNFTKMYIAGVIFISLLSGCSNDKHSNTDNTAYEEVICQPDEHNIVKIDRSLNLWFGKNKKFGLTAPEGYYIVDYDYDKADSFQYEDFVYENSVPITIKDPNDFGTPVEKIVERKDNIYQSGEHVIADVKRNINLWFGKNEMKQITAPEGYKLLDYDYDKTDYFEFETHLYVNQVSIKTDNINKYGTPIEKKDVNNSTKYEEGKHVIVKIQRNMNLWLGKDEMGQIVAPEGYCIVDYDYDKTDGFEFETIVYKNVVPVEVSEKNQLGVPLVPIEKNQETSVFEAGQHILIEIDRSLSLWLGKNGKERLIDPVGYKTIDYDYDKNDSFEFVTRVYTNTVPVRANSTNDFGTPIELEKTYTKILK